MPARKQQTHAKRARELAVKERRERKRAKKALRAAGLDPATEVDENGVPIERVDENGLPIERVDENGLPIENVEGNGVPIDEAQPAPPDGVAAEEAQ